MSIPTRTLGIALVLTLCSTVCGQPPRKPRIEDTINANVYADNSFKLYINGELVAVDSIAFVPHRSENGHGIRQHEHWRWRLHPETGRRHGNERQVESKEVLVGTGRR